MVRIQDGDREELLTVPFSFRQYIFMSINFVPGTGDTTVLMAEIVSVLMVLIVFRKMP